MTCRRPLLWGCYPRYEWRTVRHGFQKRAEGRGGFEMSRLVAMGWKSADMVEALAGWAAWIGFGGCGGRVGGVVPCCGAFDLDFLQ